jgi:hypothetical protein
MDKEPLLEPFAPHILSAIRTAFQAGWGELSRELVVDATFMRNRLAGTIANLASKGILDPHELKDRALHALGVTASRAASALAGDMSNADPDS